ncbi:MAG: hypothetical protein JOZ43_09270 [Acidobacteriales bacterium]|nr:hypothetical protein [Terriglobales bacterium]
MHRLLLAATLLFSACAFAQQDYVGKYDFYGGYAYLDSPSINLAERGLHLQAGMNPRTWYSMGFDYSYFDGNSTLLPKYLTSKLQNQLAGQLQQLAGAGLIPPSFQLAVPINSVTQTFTAGPQLNYRHFKHFTLFIHPSIGAIREVATPRTSGLDPVTLAIVNGLAPAGKKTDWTAFYGVGGGIETKLTPHIGINLTTDFVHDHLFNDVLKGRNTVRMSVGPTFHFGSNVVNK